MVITLSDHRAVPFVRDALAVPGDNALTSDSSQDEAQRGRATVAGSQKKEKKKLKSPDDNSGSRDARARRDGAVDRRDGNRPSALKGDGGDGTNGLGLELGEPAASESTAAAVGWGDFTLPGWVERFVGISTGARREQIGA